MCNHPFNFLEMNKVVYDLQFGFKRKYSTCFKLFNWQKNKRSARSGKTFAFAIAKSLELQKVIFGKVDHEVFIQKLNHYGIREVAANSFSSYIKNRLQYVSINDLSSDLQRIHHSVVLQGFILGPLLLLIYFNDFPCAISYCSVHHFTDNR